MQIWRQWPHLLLLMAMTTKSDAEQGTLTISIIIGGNINPTGYLYLYLFSILPPA